MRIGIPRAAIAGGPSSLPAGCHAGAAAQSGNAVFSGGPQKTCQSSRELTTVAAKEQAARQTASFAGQCFALGGKSMAASILIADDDANIARALSFVMRGAGHSVRTAEDGDAALAAIVAEVPALVLLDVMMPKRNGYDIARAIRAHPRCGDVRIIMLTARSRDSDRRAGLDLGVDAYITKPFALADVAAAVAEALAASAGARAEGRHGR
jgi:CheY-like chemotaxis protein